jgi:hypothetical protein
MTKSIRDIVDDLNENMELSRTLGAPIDELPDKALAVIRVLLPLMIEKTTPREAAVVIAAVYLFFISLLNASLDDAKREVELHLTDIEAAKQMLDVALDIFARAMDGQTDTDTDN